MLYIQGKRQEKKILMPAETNLWRATSSMIRAIHVIGDCYPKIASSEKPSLSGDQLRNYVYEYQDKALEVRNRVEKELAKAHIMAKIAWEKGENEMKVSLQLLRQAQ